MRCPISDRGLALYAGLGPQLLHYAVDSTRFVLTRVDDSVRLPANVQFACADRSGHFLYVISSNGGPGLAGDLHYVSSFRIDPDCGRLQAHGDPVALRHRPIHVTTDQRSEHALIAYNNPSTITVHRIEQDGGFGAEIVQPTGLDAGVFAHQICILPSNHAVILVTRGNDAADDRPEDPGALKVFNYSNGMLANRCSVAPRGGHGFGPRNVEFSPTTDWAYVSLERQNKLSVFKVDGETIDNAPSFQCDTLVNPSRGEALQIAGAVHVHPTGRFVYVANRAFAGGENTIAVYEIDEATGRPQLTQSVGTQGISPRTFSIDPSGRMLVTANSRSSNLSVFSIARDGLLTHEQRYDVDSRGEQLFWSGMV